MENHKVAWALLELADLLDLAGENPFKTRAYRIAARKVQNLPENIRDLYEQGRVQDIDGIGAAIARKIGEYLTTGEISLAKRVSQDIPPGLFDVLAVPGVGPKRAFQLHKELGISSLEELKRAAQKRELRRIKGLGNKIESAILDGIERLENPDNAKGMLLNMADEFAEIFYQRLQDNPLVQKVSIAGSLRRRVESIGDIDLVVSTARPKELADFFKTFPEFTKILVSGTTKVSAIHRSGFQVDLRIVAPQQFPSALVHFTGSKDHNIRLRQLAKEKNYRLSEYGLEGLESESQEMIEPSSEQELYQFLGLPYLVPELREDRGEIEAAQQNTLPVLVERQDIKGDLHIHSCWSDGTASIEAIAKAADQIGYEYISICDHSQSLKIAHGLDLKRLQEQHEEIARINRSGKYRVRILTGIEVDILNEALDYPDPVLAQIDVVVASVHSGFKQPVEKIMGRIELAMRNPHVDIFAHPTGRLIGRRDGYQVDLDRIIDLAVETETALEINAFPDRLDLSDLATRKAVEKGVTIAIDTDSHHLDQLEYMKYGVSVARRGWAQPEQILNCKSLSELKEWLSR